MPELHVAESFVVRIYRIDPLDPSKLSGLVEAMDGSAVKSPFIGIDELAVALSRPANRTSGRKRKGSRNRQTGDRS